MGVWARIRKWNTNDAGSGGGDMTYISLHAAAVCTLAYGLSSLYGSWKILLVMFPVTFRVPASRRSRSESNPWQQHERLELLQQGLLPALWPAARDTGISCLVSCDEEQQGQLSADRHGSTARCLRGSNAGGSKMVPLGHTVQAVPVAWRGYLVVLSGEQRGQGNWAAESVPLHSKVNVWG